MKVGQRRLSIVLDMATALHSTGSTACHEDRKVRMVMHVRIAHAAAVQKKRMIKQRPIAIGGLAEFLQKAGKQRDVELINLGHLGNLFFVIAVMR